MTAFECLLHHPGHTPHWVQWKCSRRYSPRVVAGLRMQGSAVVVSLVSGEETVAGHHEVAALMRAWQDRSADAIWIHEVSLLKVPADARKTLLFSLAVGRTDVGLCTHSPSTPKY